MKYAILLLCFLTLSGCAGSQKYYKNTNYTGNIQALLNRDIAYCSAVAAGRVPPQMPRIEGDSYSYSQGNMILRDSFGNTIDGTYNQSTRHYNPMSTANSALSIAGMIGAGRQRAQVEEMCMAQLGWYQISKEEHLQSQAGTSPNSSNTLNNGKVVFSSTPSGATVYANGNPQQIFVELSGKTPFTLHHKSTNAKHWGPECYKAVLNGVSSKTICSENYEVEREVHFEFINNAQSEVPSKNDVDAYNEAFQAKIRGDHPDFVSLPKEQRNQVLNDIRMWIAQKPYSEAKPMSAVFDSGNAQEISDLLTRYKKELGIINFK